MKNKDPLGSGGTKNKTVVSHEIIPRWIVIVFFTLFLVGAGLIIFVFIFSGVYKEKIFPGISVGVVSLTGRTPAEAEKLLATRINELIDQDFTFKYKAEEINIPTAIEDPANPELSSPLVTFDINKTVNEIMTAQKRRNEAERMFYWITGGQAAASFRLDEEKLGQLLDEKLNKYQQPAVNAALVIGQDDAISITSEKGGQAFNYERIFSQVRRNLLNLSGNTIILELEADVPKITKAEGEQLVEIIKQVLTASPFIVMYADRSWELPKDKVRQWLELQTGAAGQPTVGLNQASLANYLRSVADEINVPVKEGKFTMENGKVVNFQPSQKGLELQLVDSANLINQKIRQVGIKEIDLVVRETEPAATTNDVNNLGIKELVGEGHSNFKGSPKNRRHNISVGANTLNGILIKPGEEFSLVKALGKIEASTGYLPELVIKGNKTIPEFGGGLCQIGTTTFRAALDAGLPITARTNHSYRVSYYEPAGTDATIYDPQPDFKFINDTGYHLLFTTEITGDDLYFRFYGTPDGRAVEQTKPRVFNLVKPGPANLIETLDLKPGEKKCTEKAHTGADTEFTRTVIYPSGDRKVDVFKSHYKPWREVCLIGVEKLSEDTAAE